MSESGESISRSRAEEVLRRYWGHESFRSGQWEAVEAVLGRQDTLVIFPTGGGKSVCYQLPSLVLDGCVLVISPLISLMQDQVAGLHARGVDATFLHGGLGRRRIDQRWTDIEHGRYNVVYMAPERLDSDMFRARVNRLNIAVLAVDEAHCISKWGHNFRPAYRKIGEIRDEIPDVPVIALTATATPDVRRDIVHSLDLDSPRKIIRGFDRPNIVWSVLYEEDKRSKVQGVLNRVGGSVIVYLPTRRKVEQWTEDLRRDGIPCIDYHGGMESAVRERHQEQWVADEVRVMVATNAFGMGIDKPDVRAVIHGTMPASVEAYYQEAGRAGRDGQKAYAVLLAQPGDTEIQELLIDQTHPSQKEIQQVYAAVCNLAQIPTGSLPEQLVPVDRTLVAEVTGLAPGKIGKAIELLEQEEVWYEVDLPPNRVVIRFVQSIEGIRDTVAEMGNARLKQFVQDILRTVYADADSTWYELDIRLLEKKTGLSRDRIARGLEYLADREMVAVHGPGGDSTRLQFLQARSQQVMVDTQEIKQARRRAEKNLRDMQRYVWSVHCRRQFLLRYFGQSAPDHCGACDNCMGRHEPLTVTPRHEPILREIMGRLQESVTPLELMDAEELSVPSYRVRQLLQWLVQEEYVQVDDPVRDQYTLTEKGREWTE